MEDGMADVTMPEIEGEIAVVALTSVVIDSEASPSPIDIPLPLPAIYM